LDAGFVIGKEGMRRWLDLRRKATLSCGSAVSVAERKARALACGPGGLLGLAQAESGGGESGRARAGGSAQSGKQRERRRAVPGREQPGRLAGLG
jgi:hypothetical protein